MMKLSALLASAPLPPVLRELDELLRTYAKEHRHAQHGDAYKGFVYRGMYRSEFEDFGSWGSGESRHFTVDAFMAQAYGEDMSGGDGGGVIARFPLRGFLGLTLGPDEGWLDAYGPGTWQESVAQTGCFTAQGDLTHLRGAAELVRVEIASPTSYRVLPL